MLWRLGRSASACKTAPSTAPKWALAPLPDAVSRLPIHAVSCLAPRSAASMVHRYDTGHNSKRCGFSGDGESVLSCAGDDCGLVMLDVRGGGVQIAEAFEEVSEARNRASYVISPDGTKVGSPRRRLRHLGGRT